MNVLGFADHMQLCRNCLTLPLWCENSHTICKQKGMFGSGQARNGLGFLFADPHIRISGLICSVVLLSLNLHTLYQTTCITLQPDSFPQYEVTQFIQMNT